MHTFECLSLYLEEKPLEGRTGVGGHVFNLDVGQTVEQQQREASDRLEPLATHEERLLGLLRTERSETLTRCSWTRTRNTFRGLKNKYKDALGHVDLFPVQSVSAFGKETKELVLY